MATDLPTLLDTLQSTSGSAPAAPSVVPASPPPNITGNLFTSALKSGGYGALSNFAGAVAAGAKLAGFDTGAANAEARAQDFAQSAEQAGRADIEQQGFTGGGIGGALKYGAYQLTKGLPTLAGLGLSTAAAAELLPEAAAGGLAARVGAAVPEALGGGSAEAGQAILAGGAAMAPLSTGELYNKASEQPGGATRADALKAFALGLPIGMIQAVGPHGAGGLAENVLTHAGAFGLGSGLQEAADSTYDPNMTAGERAERIVQATASGAALGGLFGGARSALSPFFGRAPSTVSNDDMSSVINEAIAPTSGIDAMTPDQRPASFYPQTQQQLPLGPVYRTADFGTTGQGDLFQESTLGQTPRGPMGEVPQAGGPIPDPLYAARLARYAGDDGAAPPVSPNLADLTARLTEARSRQSTPDLKTLATSLRGPVEPQEAQGLTPAQDSAIKAAMGVEAPLEPAPARFTDEELYAPEVGAPRGDEPLPPIGAADDAAAIERDKARIKAMYPDKAVPTTQEGLAQSALFGQFGDDGQAIGNRGVMRDWIDHSSATNDVELFNSMKDELDAKSKVSKTAGFKDMAQQIGLLGEDNKPLDIPAERAKLDEIPNVGARQKMSDFLDQVESRQDQAAQVREPTEPRELGPTPTLTPEALPEALPEAPTQSTTPEAPKSIADRVLDAAHDLTGGTGGEARIADIRDRLPDVAPADIDNALRQIHTDDSDSSLTQAPKGQRTGVDGVAVQGQGRFHNLSVEPREAEAAPSVRDRIEAIMDSRQQGDIVGLDTIRSQLKDVPRADVDAALREINGDPNARDVLSAHDDPRQITSALRDATLNVSANDPRHVLLKGAPRNVQERSAAQEVVRDQSEAGARDGGGDAEARQSPGAQPDASGAEGERQAPAQAGAGEVAHDMPNVTKAAETVAPNGATSLPVEAVGAEPAQVAARLEEQPERFPPPADSKIMPFQTEQGARDPVTPNSAILPRDQVDSITKDAISSLKPELQRNVSVIGSADELPQNIVQAARAQGLDLSTSPGLYMDGKVYIRADMMRSPEEVQNVVAHEVFGHMGTVEQLGGRDEVMSSNRYDNAMQSIVDRLGGKNGVIRLSKQLGIYEPGEGMAGIKEYLRQGTDLRDVVDEVIAHATSSGSIPAEQRPYMAFVGRVKEAIADMLRKAGLDDFAKRFETFTPSDVQKWLEDSRAALEGRPPADKIDMASLPGMRADLLRNMGGRVKPMLREGTVPIREQNELTNTIARVGGALREKIISTPQSNLAQGIKKITRSFMTAQDMERSFGKEFKQMGRINELSRMSEVATANLTLNKVRVQRELGALKNSDRAAFDEYNNLVQSASLLGLDPTKPFVENTWLRDAPNIDKLREEHQRLAQVWNKWGQPGKDGRAAGTLRDLYTRQQLALKSDQLFLHAERLTLLAKGMGGIEGLEKSPVQEFAVRNDLHRDPQASNDFARAGLETRLKSLDTHLQNMQPGSDREVLANAVDNIRSSVKSMDQTPYTHLGRSGDYGVSFRLRAGEDGTTADPASVAAIRKAADDVNMGDLQFNTVGTNRDVFVKFKDLNTAQRFSEKLQGMQDHFDPEKLPKAGSVVDGSISAGNISPELKMIESRVAEQLKDSPAAQAAALKEIRGAWLDALPQDASAKLQERREGVQGFSGNLLENQAFRDQVSANALGHLSNFHDIATEKASIAKQMEAAKEGLDPIKAANTQSIGQAFLDRSAAQDTRVPSSGWDKLRAMAHGYYLGMSPGYWVMQVAQPYTLALPELAKHHGFFESGKALTGSLNDVGVMLKSMAKVQAEAYRAHQRGEVTDITAGVTPRVLEIAQRDGLSPDMAKYLQAQDNMGLLEMGTFAHSNFEGFRGSDVSNAGTKALRMLNSSATMAELSSRLVASIAAKKLYDKLPEGQVKDRIDKLHGGDLGYGAHVTRESMFDWGGSTTSQAMSKSGYFGKASPVIFQFHGFSTRLFNKLTQEGYNAIKGDSPEERAEARKFMLAHLTAVTALSGTLGLPFAGWAAGAITKASTLMPGSGGEAYDVEAHWSHFLKTVFGNQLGEAINHGLPRLVNSDFSDLGDKDLLPMQSFMEDRRKLEDGLKDYFMHAWGSSIGAGVGALEGARDFADGKPLVGLAKILPTAMRNFVKAYQINEHGYVNSQGEKLPIDASAMSVLRQALGMQSGDKSEYDEENRAYQGFKGDRAYHAGLIKQQVARAVESGDQDSFKQWMTEASRYDADPAHVGSPVSPTIPGYLAQRQRAMAYSKSTGLPLGVNPRDLPAMQLLGG